jgi:hypothetical protein
MTRPPPLAAVALSGPNHWSPKLRPLVVKVQFLERSLLVKFSCHVSFQADPLPPAAVAVGVDVDVDIDVRRSDGN